METPFTDANLKTYGSFNRGSFQYVPVDKVRELEKVKIQLEEALKFVDDDDGCFALSVATKIKIAFALQSSKELK